MSAKAASVSVAGPCWRCVHEPVVEHDLGGRAAKPARRDLGQPLAQRLAGGAHRRAVEVRAARRRRRRRVGHLVGARRHDANRVERYAERVGGDLQDLRVQPLTHLGAAVVHLHAAVLVDQHQRAGLVVERRGERDAELHRRHRQPALAVRAAGVELVDLAPPLVEVARWRAARPRCARCDRRRAPPARSAWCRRARRSCARAPPRAAAPACARCGRGSPRSRPSPAARRSRETRCARRDGCGRPGPRSRRRAGNSSCRRGTSRAPSPARSGPGSSRRR